MIQPLRTVHRRLFVGLALVLPMILLAGLVARHPVRPGEAQERPLPAAGLSKTVKGLKQSPAIQYEIYSASGTPRDLYVVLRSDHELNEPDLLLYWSDSEPKGSSLQADARFLGNAVVGKATVLPRDLGASGYLVLYSLGHHLILDMAPVENLP